MIGFYFQKLFSWSKLLYHLNSILVACNTCVMTYAAMAELVDALDSGSSRGNSVDVRVILAATRSFILDEYP